MSLLSWAVFCLSDCFEVLSSSSRKPVKVNVLTWLVGKNECLGWLLINESRSANTLLSLSLFPPKELNKQSSTAVQPSWHWRNETKVLDSTFFLSFFRSSVVYQRLCCATWDLSKQGRFLSLPRSLGRLIMKVSVGNSRDNNSRPPCPKSFLSIQENCKINFNDWIEKFEKNPHFFSSLRRPGYKRCFRWGKPFCLWPEVLTDKPRWYLPRQSNSSHSVRLMNELLERTYERWLGKSADRVQAETHAASNRALFSSSSFIGFGNEWSCTSQFEQCWIEYASKIDFNSTQRLGEVRSFEKPEHNIMTWEAFWGHKLRDGRFSDNETIH